MNQPTHQFITDEHVTRVFLRVSFLGDETEEFLFGLVISAVGDAVQRVLVQDPLQSQIIVRVIIKTPSSVWHSAY